MRGVLLAGVLCAGSAQAEFAAEIPDDGFVRLDNGTSLSVTIAPQHGGELAGLRVFFDGGWHEVVYRAEDYSPTEGWRGKAPLLWPAVGMTLDPGGEGRGYRLDGRHYPMPAHGFARDRAWALDEYGTGADHARAVLSLASDDASGAMYPFDFELLAEYRVHVDRLAIEYTVRAGAANGAAMPFCIGNHVTFRAPLIGEGEAGAVRFANDFPDWLQREDDRTFAGRLESSPFRGEHPVSVLPRRSAVGLGGPPGPAALAVIDPSGLVLWLRHAASAEPEPPAIRFNLWADVEEGFFSPEPWIGTQNCLNTGAGAIRLEPGAEWRWRIEIIPSGMPGPHANEVDS